MSKICPNCNNSVPDGTVFCTFCGSKIPSGSVNKVTGGSGYNGGKSGGNATYSNMPEDVRGLVVDQNEKFIAGLRDSVAKTFVAGDGLGKNKVFFTNKRLYAKTSRFNLKKGLETHKFVVPIKDITGINIVHENPIQWLIFAIICLLLVFLSPVTLVGTLIFVIAYFANKGTYLHISYPGKTTILSVKMYSYDTVSEFQKKAVATINK